MRVKRTNVIGQRRRINICKDVVFIKAIVEIGKHGEWTGYDEKFHFISVFYRLVSWED